MDVNTWQYEIQDWARRSRNSSDDLAEQAVSFFKLAFTHTRCVNHAWFGIHPQTISLVVGGIFLAALMRSGEDKGLWLLVDQNPPKINGLEYQLVKSTKNSDAPLLWAHSESLSIIQSVIAQPELWNSYSSASLKVMSSSTSSSARDAVQERRNKRRLSEFWPVFRNPQNSIFPDEIADAVPLREGTVRKVTVNAYERNSEARQKCIEHFGATCQVCEFDFGNKFGALADGFIHVHHLKPISGIGEDYEINPIQDLRPVGPNCHAVIHFRNPPYTLDEVKRMLS